MKGFKKNGKFRPITRPLFVSRIGYQFEVGDKVKMDKPFGRLTDYDQGVVLGRDMDHRDNPHLFKIKNTKTGEITIYNNLNLESVIPHDYSNKLHNPISINEYLKIKGLV